MIATTTIIVSYLFGSIASAIVVCRIFTLPDPRKVGSKNPGATNVLRIGGKTPAFLTLLGDVLKGLIPVMIAKLFELPETVIIACGLAAFIGHLYPVFFGFIGGKGVATAMGALVAIDYRMGISVIICWLLVAAAARYSSLASLASIAMAPVAAWYWGYNVVSILLLMFLVLLLFWRHRGNIGRLINGTESKIGMKTQSQKK